MRKLLISSIIALAFAACNGKRPAQSDFKFDIEIRSVLSNARVELYSDDRLIGEGETDKLGTASISDISAVQKLSVKVCGGEMTLLNDITWSGCMEKSFDAASKGRKILVVDFISTMASVYQSETALNEWLDYLFVETDTAPEANTTLTDSAKRWLWHLGLAKIAQATSDSQETTPETRFSTEKLFNLLVSDLADNNKIDGSTDESFGLLKIDQDILKGVIADILPSVSENFSSADLHEWTEHLRTSDAAFFGKTDGETDNAAPVVTIEKPASGELIFGITEIKASAKDNNKIIGLSCSVLDSGIYLEDEDEAGGLFSSRLDTTLLDDGEITVKCTATDGLNAGSADVKARISNKNKVVKKPFVTNPAASAKAVEVYDFDGRLIDEFKDLDIENNTISLAPGKYRVAVRDASYSPVFIEDSAVLSFDLETRAEIKAGSETSVVATPLTTLREALYRALLKKGSSDKEAETKSLELISNHFDRDFPLYIEPKSKKMLSESSKYFIVLASLERVAGLIAEEQDQNFAAVSINDVMAELTSDLDEDEVAVLDGFGEIGGFKSDSYLFRYWYAIALKLFLEDEKNSTELEFSDLQTVINNISTDRSELFPEDAGPKKVTDQPPVIADKQFRHTENEEYQNYSADNIIYANNDPFFLRFSAEPCDQGDLSLRKVSVSGDAEASLLQKDEESGLFSAVVSFLPGSADGDLSVNIEAEDDARNRGTATLMAVKDTIPPVIEKPAENLSDIVYTTLPHLVAYKISEENPHFTEFSIAPNGTTGQVMHALNDPLSGQIEIKKEDIQEDRLYELKIISRDLAKNFSTRSVYIFFDTNPPELNYSVDPALNESGFIKTETLEVTLLSSDDNTAPENIRHEHFKDGAWIADGEGNYSNIFTITHSDGEYDEKFRAVDSAGNTNTLTIRYFVDTTPPVLTIHNKSSLSTDHFRSGSEELKLSVTCEDAYFDKITYSIDNALPVEIADQAETAPLDIEGDGMHSVKVSCLDKAGNETSDTLSIFIDNTPPEIVFTPHNIPTSSRSSADVTFSVTEENLQKLEYAYIWNDIRFPNSGFYEIEGNSSGNYSLTIPAPADAAGIDLEGKVSDFIVEIKAADKAKNQSGNETGFTIDKEPATILGGAAWISQNGVSSLMVSAFTDGSVTAVGQCPALRIYAQKYNGGIIQDITTRKTASNFNELPQSAMKICSYNLGPAEINTTYLVALAPEDEFENFTSDINRCKPLNTIEEAYCFAGFFNTDSPSLNLEITGESGQTINYAITTNGLVTSCKIYDTDNNEKKSCGTAVYPLSNKLVTSDLDNGRYYISVTVRNSSNNVQYTKNHYFAVDREHNNFSCDVSFTYSDPQKKYASDQNSLILKVQAEAPGGLQEVQVYLEGRRVHVTRSSGGTSLSCENELCYDNSYSKKILDWSWRFTPVLIEFARAKSTVLPALLPWSLSRQAVDITGFADGAYEKYKCVIKSRDYWRDPVTVTKDFSPALNIARSTLSLVTASDIQYEGKDFFTVKFRPSVLSKMKINNEMQGGFENDIAIKVSDSPEFQNICYSKNDSESAYLYRRNELARLRGIGLNKISYSSDEKLYTAEFSTVVAPYSYQKVWCGTYDDSGIDQKIDCKSPFSKGCTARECGKWEDSDGWMSESYCASPYVYCSPDETAHYFDSTKLVSQKICKGSWLNDICQGGFFQTCEEYLRVHGEAMETCTPMIDFHYVPEGTKITVSDDFSKVSVSTDQIASPADSCNLMHSK